MTPEVEQLRSTLDELRAGILRKLAGLSDQDVRRSTVDSGTNLAGLVQHLTFVESKWFEEIVAGGKVTRGDRSMRVDPSVSLRTLRAEYRAACAASNEIVGALGDAEAAVSGDRKGRAISDGPCSRSSRRLPDTPDTLTSSASRSMARPGAEALPRRHER